MRLQIRLNAVKVKGIGKMVKNKELRSTAIFRIYPGGEPAYLFDGVEYSQPAFDSLYPVTLSAIEIKGKNSNRQVGWLKGNKSY